MLEVIIGVVVAVLLVAGFWLTRGAGGMPGGVGDPAQEQLARSSALGAPLPEPGEEEPQDREDQVE